MKAEQTLKIISEQAGFSLEGHGNKSSASGKLLGFPVTATVATQMLMPDTLTIVFHTEQAIDLKKLEQTFEEQIEKSAHKNLFAVQKSQGKSKGAAIAGMLGGAIGGAIHGALTGGGKGGDFELLITMGKDDEGIVIAKYQEALAALELALKQMGIAPDAG
ncbi:MAG: hypothetical protein FWG66_03595 [Spirochaetes bacterium]|nr:hypothetical protein [Spirochaetota bacterium]